MRPTELATGRDDGVVQCQVCQWRCAVAPGEYGRCLVRRNDAGTLMALNDGLISAATIGPMEDYGFLHFFPDSLVFAVGSWGTPFPKEQDAEHYAQIPAEGVRTLEAERAVRFAQERLCRGVIWTYNEPVMAFEYLTDGVRLARAASRITGLVTGGYWTVEALNSLGPYLDGVNLRLFGFSDASYQTLAGVERWREILEATQLAFKKWRCHIELTLQLQPGVNDGTEELTALAAWVRDQLSPLIPVHVMPCKDVSPGATVAARQLLRQEGLRFVYGPDRTESTHCPGCGFPVAHRAEKHTRLIGVKEGHCENCGADLYFRTSIFKAGFNRAE
jgi:pyruvate formate lyase activating enzyme